MIVAVKFFALCREITGITSMNVDFEENSVPISSLLSKVCEKYPKLSPKLDSISIAVNTKYERDMNYMLSAGDVVAFLPPISGG